MKRLALILGSSLLFGAASASAAEFSGNVSIGTDYVYRGFTQTGEAPTIQGGFDVAADSGLYAGIWASNINFDGSIEVDYYFGYGGEINEDVAYDVGYIYYFYPDQPAGQPDSNFQEIYASLSFKGLTGGFAYSNEFFAETGKATYYYLDYELGLPEDFAVGFHYGASDFDGGGDYNDYSIGLSKSYNDFDFSLTWSDTDVNGCANVCDGRVVFAIGKSL